MREELQDSQTTISEIRDTYSQKSQEESVAIDNRKSATFLGRPWMTQNKSNITQRVHQTLYRSQLHRPR
jgi:hypothetical protein